MLHSDVISFLVTRKLKKKQKKTKMIENKEEIIHIFWTTYKFQYNIIKIILKKNTKKLGNTFLEKSYGEGGPPPPQPF